MLMTLVIAAFGSCQRVNIFVDHDYRFSENFKNYSTYTFVECEQDTTYFCSDIHQAIERQMAARGYTIESQKANLYVNFSVYSERFQYKGYDQPQLVNWLISRKTDDTVYTPVKYQLGKGTLMISMIEASINEIVWRGYTTGIYNDQMHKKNYFKGVVRIIFDEYPLFAEGKQRSSIRRLTPEAN